MFRSIWVLIFILLSLSVTGSVKAEPNAGDAWKDPVTGMEFVWIPGGTFEMGQGFWERARLIKSFGLNADRKDFDTERPRHKVEISGFWMGKYEVTNAQYKRFRPDHDSGDYEGYSLRDDHMPVVNISSVDADAFAEWMSSRGSGTYCLPTEAQWEYAARAGVAAMFPWGNDPGEACAWANAADAVAKAQWPDWTCLKCNDGHIVASPVGSFPPNGFGLYDMIGNVWEFCQDHYSPTAYESHAAKDPVSIGDDNRRIARGGSWGDGWAGLRSANRNAYNPEYTSCVIGMRLVRLPDER
jgi:formylglycine-generating enzyme